MADFKEIDQARKILGLSEYATLKKIHSAYRKLALKYHPDRCNDTKKHEHEAMFKKIAASKDLLSAYCAGYRYSFKEKDVRRNSYGEDFYKHLQKFYDGWWGEI